MDDDADRPQAGDPPAPDRARWRDPASYRAAWDERARLAASLVPDGVSVLEIGVGTGALRELVRVRTRYVGADLEPLDATTVQLDIDRDPLPGGRYEYVVALGVFTYLHRPHAAAEKICGAAEHAIVSYCCRRDGADPGLDAEARSRRGWVNAFDRAEFIELFARFGHRLASSIPLALTADIEEYLMEFRRAR